MIIKTTMNNKLDKLKEKGKFLETWNMSKLNHKDRENLNRAIMNSKIDSIIKTK